MKFTTTYTTDTGGKIHRKPDQQAPAPAQTTNAKSSKGKE